MHYLLMINIFMLKSFELTRNCFTFYIGVHRSTYLSIDCERGYRNCIVATMFLFSQRSERVVRLLSSPNNYLNTI